MPPSYHKQENQQIADEETPFVGSPNEKKASGAARNYASGMRSWILPQYLVAAGIGLLVGVAITAGVGGGRHHTTATNGPSADSAEAPQQNAKYEATSPFSSYKSFQGLSFAVYTGGAPAFIPDESNTTLIDNPECFDRNSYGHFGAFNELQCYLGLDDEKEDAARRLQVMTDAVERAYEQADKDPSVLKIFVAPEFFFRGLDGAYIFSGSNCGPVCQILKGLENLVEDDRFDDWLFLFGTVIASEALPSDDPFDYLFYNFAPMYKGGKNDKNNHLGKRFLVPKRIVSNMDFLTPERYFNHTESLELMDHGAPERPNQASTLFNPYNVDHFRYDNEVWTKYKAELTELGYTMVEYNWLKMDNITFTVEICVDHAAHSAITAYDADMVSGRKTIIPSGGANGLSYTSIPTHQAQISLVSSAGMALEKDSFALVDNGAIMLQDGDYNDRPWQHYDNPIKRTGLTFEGGFELAQRRAVLTSTEIYFEYRTVDKAYQVHPVYDTIEEVDEALMDIFSITQYEPSVVVYDPIKIAPVPQ